MATRKRQQASGSNDQVGRPTSSSLMTRSSLLEPERLFNEANLLRLEGRLFCFDPKEAGRRGGAAQTFEEKVKLEEVVKQPLIIKPDPEVRLPLPARLQGAPGNLEEAHRGRLPGPDSVSFSQRELARLIGRTSFGGSAFQASSTERSCSSTRPGCSAPSTTRRPTNGRPQASTSSTRPCSPARKPASTPAWSACIRGSSRASTTSTTPASIGTGS